MTVNKKDRWVFWILGLATTVLIGFIAYRGVSHSLMDSGPAASYSLAMKEQADEHFQEATRAKWGQKSVVASETNRIKELIAKQRIFFDPKETVSLSDLQRQRFYSTFVDFIDSYSSGQLSNILDFHARAPYQLDIARIDTPTFRKELKRDELPPPKDASEELTTYWTYLQRLTYRTEFWLRYRDEQKKSGKTANPNSVEAFREYLLDLKLHPSAYRPPRFLALSESFLDASMFAAREPVERLGVKMAKLNNGNYHGSQVIQRTLFEYEETPAKVIAENGDCIYAVVEMAIQTDLTDAYVPCVVVFHWAPRAQTWLPDFFVRHSRGGFELLF
jgi:hypothetical protein